jgi:predicted Ser/Thr protein kinase
MEKKMIDSEIITVIKGIEGLTSYSIKIIQEQINLKLPRISFPAIFEGKRATVRIYSEKNKVSRSHFFNEISALTELQNFGKKFQPQIFSISRKNLSIIESYIEGKPAGSLFDFNRKFIDEIDPKKIINLLDEFKKIHPKLEFDRQELRIGNLKRLKVINKEFDSQKVTIWSDNYIKIFDRDISDGGSFSHGDVSAGNIIFDQKSVYLIDWESAKYEPYFRDFASAYYRALNFPEWQANFIKAINFIDERKKESFFAYYIFILLSDAASLKIMDKAGKRNYFRSGEMSELEIKNKIKKNYLEAMKFL